MQSVLISACGEATPGAGGSSGTIYVPDSSPLREHRDRNGAAEGGRRRRRDGDDRPGDTGHFVAESPGNLRLRFCSAWSSAAPKTGETEIMYAPWSAVPKQAGGEVLAKWRESSGCFL